MRILKKITTFLIVPIIMLSLNSMAIGVTHAIDQQTAQSDVCAGIGTATGTGNGSCSGGGGSSVGSIIATVINILSLIVGAAAVIMVIIGGLRYIISSGDSNASNSARNTIIYALVGLAIASLAQVLVHFVLYKFA